jgi:hypothetical protein
MDEIPYLLHLPPEISPAPLPLMTSDNIKLESDKEEILIQETLSDENPSKKVRSSSADNSDMSEDHISCDTTGSNSESSDDEEWLKAIEKGEE